MTGEAKPIYSMTGFAGCDCPLSDGRHYAITLKSVNHRHLDLAVRLPGSLDDALEHALRQMLKAGIRRGHVELTLVLEKPAGAAPVLQLDEAALAAHIDAYRRAAALHGITAEPDLNALLRAPGVMSAAVAKPAAQADPSVARDVLTAAKWAVDLLNKSRALEGAALAAELLSAMTRISTLAEEARQLREGVAAGHVARLRQRLAELLDGQADLPEDRILAEAALLAERSDVDEELVRLRTHIARFEELLAAGGELGRQLDFLLQELNREANTLLSKTGAAAGEGGLRLTEIGLALKLELERAREQVQNLE